MTSGKARSRCSNDGAKTFPLPMSWLCFFLNDDVSWSRFTYQLDNPGGTVSKSWRYSLIGIADITGPSLNQPESVFCHEIKSWLITLSGKTVTAALYHPSQQFLSFCLLSSLYTNHANSFFSGFAHLLHQSEMPSESLPHCPLMAHPNSQSQEALLTL